MAGSNGKILRANSKAWHRALHREVGCALLLSCCCHPARLPNKPEGQAICSLGVPFLSVLFQPLGDTASLNVMKLKAARQPESSPVAQWESQSSLGCVVQVLCASNPGWIQGHGCSSRAFTLQATPSVLPSIAHYPAHEPQTGEVDLRVRQELCPRWDFFS